MPSTQPCNRIILFGTFYVNVVFSIRSLPLAVPHCVSLLATF
jgi:hypothetical protein